MRIKKTDLNWAASQGFIDESKVQGLWEALNQKVKDRPSFNFAHMLYYFGALIVIGAMSFFMNTAWELLGGWGVFVIASLYATAFYALALKLRNKEGLRIPAGLLATLGVVMTPLITYGLQRGAGVWAFDDPGEYLDFHKWIKGGWFFMEAATIIVGFVALRYFKFPFLTAPIAFCLWYISMDLTPIIFGDSDFTFDQRKLVSLYFGLAVILASYIIDLRSEHDFAFWGYLFGTLAFWGGLSLMNSDSELSKFLYCLINIFMIGLSVFLQRKVFIIFGALGVSAYLFHLADDIFPDSLHFPFTLSALGLLVLYSGYLSNKHGHKIEERMMSLLPSWAIKLRPMKSH